MTDRLTLTRAFESAGFKSTDAERIATEIYDAIHENVATKADITASRTELSADIAALRAELSADIAALRAELSADIAAVRTELGADIAAVRTDLERQIDRMVVRLGAVIVIVAGALFSALHYWPPHS